MTALPKSSFGANFSYGDLFKFLNDAVNHLKEKGVPRTRTELEAYLSFQYADENALKEFFNHLRKRQDVTFTSGDDGGSFAYKPKIPVKNPEQLKGYLKSRPNSVGVRFDDLKDGWPGCQPHLDRMEKERQILLLRDRKNTIKLVWDNEPALTHQTSDDVKTAWNNIKLPANPDDIRLRLDKAGIKPTSAPRVIKKAVAKKEKKKGPKRRGRETNAHVAHKLKDISHLIPH